MLYKQKVRVFVAISFAALIGAAGLALTDKAGTVFEYEGVIAQTFSTRCQTPSGQCFVPAAQVGTSCFCANTQQWGTIVP
jgi:hypothetical protein